MATAVLDDEEAVQQSKRRGRHGEQIHCGDVVLVVAQERYPSLHLVGLGWASPHVSRHSHFTDDESELLELGVDTRCAPAVLRHRADEVTDLGINPRSAWLASARDPSPVSSESIPIPPGDYVCVDDDQAARPRRPRASERNPESAVRVVERWPGALLLERRHLLPQSKVFNYEVGAPPTHRPQRPGAEGDEEYENTEHCAAECALSAS